MTVSPTAQTSARRSYPSENYTTTKQQSPVETIVLRESGEFQDPSGALVYLHSSHSKNSKTVYCWVSYQAVVLGIPVVYTTSKTRNYRSYTHRLQTKDYNFALSELNSVINPISLNLLDGDEDEFIS